MRRHALEGHEDLPARIRAAKALSRLAHALVRHRADPAVLDRIADDADRLAADIETEPVRKRRMELVESPGFDDAVRAGSLAELMADGAFVDVFEDSPVSGSANPLSMGLKVSHQGDEAVGRVTLSPGFQGAPDRAHGGVVAAIVDEVYGALLPLLGEMAFTGELSVRYVAPCPMGEPLEFRARSVDRDGRKIFTACEGSSAAGVFVTSRATFICVDLGSFRTI